MKRDQRDERSNTDEELDSSPLESFAGKKEGKDLQRGERNDFFGNYLILIQSGMEKRVEIPKKSQMKHLKTLNNRSRLSDQTEV